jgi:hypothetical protein
MDDRAGCMLKFRVTNEGLELNLHNLGTAKERKSALGLRHLQNLTFSLRRIYSAS